MEWIVIFIMSWIMFFYLIAWMELKINIWNGILAAIIQLTVDWEGTNHGFYRLVHTKVELFHSPVFFTFGPVFVIAVLLSQYMPSGRWPRIFHVLVLGSLYSILEVLLDMRGCILYFNWDYADSIRVNFTVISSLSWFSLVVLNKGGASKT